MSLLVLESNNPEFSHILQKNPNSVMQVRQMKEGKAFGFFPTKYNGKAYVIHFKDGYDEVSFKKDQDEEFEYLNLSRYNSSMFIFTAMKEFLSHLENNRYKDADKDTEGFEHTVLINMVYTGIPKYLTFFINSFPDFELKFVDRGAGNFKIMVTTKKTLHQLVNYINLLSIFLVMINDNEFLFIDEQIVERYIKVMNNLEAPYYIRYLFKLKFLSAKTKYFEKFKTAVEKSNKENIEMMFGDTHTQRIFAIQNLLGFDKNILDLGCGEGRYLLKFAPKLNEDLLYYGIDKEQAVLDELKFKIERKEIENVILYNSLDEFISIMNDNDEEFDVICSEVIEHIEIDKLKPFVIKILEFVASRKNGSIIFTTPNAEFNQFYYLTEMRHKDHKWEWNNLEFVLFFREMISMILKKNNNLDAEFEVLKIGDKVNGISVTQGIKIRFFDKKEKISQNKI